MSAALACRLALALALATPWQAPGEGGSTPDAPPHRTEEERAGFDLALVERWRERVDLELYGEVLAEGDAVRASGMLDRNGQAMALLARALFETRGPEAALELLDEAGPRATAETAAFVRLERARCLIELDRLEHALAELGVQPGASAPADHTHPEAWLYLGRVHARRGELESARAPLECFLELAPRHREAPSALYVLAQEALRRGDGEAARKLAARGQELSQWLAYLRVRRLQVRETPDEPLPRLGLALVWMGAGEHERAAGVLDELLARHPEHASGWFHRGEVHRLAGELEAARAAWDRAVALDEGELLARFNRAVLARMQGRDDAAREDFEWLVEHHPDDPRLAGAHLELARLLKQAGDEAGAAERYAAYRARGGREPLE